MLCQSYDDQLINQFVNWWNINLQIFWLNFYKEFKMICSSLNVNICCLFNLWNLYASFNIQVTKLFYVAKNLVGSIWHLFAVNFKVQLQSARVWISIWLLLVWHIFQQHRRWSCEQQSRRLRHWGRGGSSVTEDTLQIPYNPQNVCVTDETFTCCQFHNRPELFHESSWWDTIKRAGLIQRQIIG